MYALIDYKTSPTPWTTGIKPILLEILLSPTPLQPNPSLLSELCFKYLSTSSLDSLMSQIQELVTQVWQRQYSVLQYQKGSTYLGLLEHVFLIQQSQVSCLCASLSYLVFCNGFLIPGFDYHEERNEYREKTCRNVEWSC
jgi:hypothetical protein